MDSTSRYKVYIFLIFALVFFLIWQINSLIGSLSSLSDSNVAASANLDMVKKSPLFERLAILSPKPGDSVDKSFHITGYGQDFFEGAVSIKVFDDEDNLLLSDTLTLQDNYGKPAAFDTIIVLENTPKTVYGRIVFYEHSAKDGSIRYQTTRTIKFSGK